MAVIVVGIAEPSMQHTLEVANIMCGGCADTIQRELGAVDGVSGVAVDVPTGKVSFDAASEDIPAIRSRLAAIGYPEKSAPPAAAGGLSSLIAKAKTFAC